MCYPLGETGRLVIGTLPVIYLSHFLVSEVWYPPPPIRRLGQIWPGGHTAGFISRASSDGSAGPLYRDTCYSSLPKSTDCYFDKGIMWSSPVESWAQPWGLRGCKMNDAVTHCALLLGMAHRHHHLLSCLTLVTLLWLAGIDPLNICMHIHSTHTQRQAHSPICTYLYIHAHTCTYMHTHSFS